MDFKIYNLRDKQVMLDSDLAKLYQIKTRVLNQAVNRNYYRFPNDFAFKLTEKEFDNLKSQTVTSSWGGRRKLPLAFTEHGVAMLSSVLKSKKAVEVNIKIIKQFIQMRKFLAKNAGILQRVQENSNKLLEHDKKFDKIFNSLQKESPLQGIFYDGQIFDAYEFVKDLISKAKNKIILIDNYVNYETLALFKDLKIKILIKTNITDSLKKDYEKYCLQYNNISLEEFTKSHDRFLVIDNDIYHIGASLKDLGKKWFAFSKMFSKLDYFF